MAKQRDLIRMSETEIEEFVAASKSMILATLDKTGVPHQTVLWFGIHDGTYLFETYGTAQKAVNLRRDPRASILWEAGDTYYQLRGVSIQGRAEIIETEPRLSELMTVIARRTIKGLSEESLAEHVVGLVRKRIVIAIHPEKTISWDHRKLPAPAAH